MTNRLELQPAQVICGRHGEPFKPAWPAGYPLFAAYGFQMLMEQDGFRQACEKVAVEQGVADPVLAAGRLLDLKPICCRLGQVALLRLYLHVQGDVKVWPVKRCTLCGRKGEGSEYRMAPPTAKSAAPRGTWPHVCLRCVVKPA